MALKRRFLLKTASILLLAVTGGTRPAAAVDANSSAAHDSQATFAALHDDADMAAGRENDSRAIILTMTHHLENNGDTTAQVRLEAPLLDDEPVSYQQVLSESFGPHLKEISSADAERTGTFVVLIPPGERRSITQRYVLVLHPFRSPDLSGGSRPERTAAVPRSDDAAPTLPDREKSRFLSDEPGIEASAPVFVRLAERITEEFSSTAEKAGAIFAYVRRHLHYDPASPARHKGALAGYRAGSGVCTEYARLFVALTRAAGIPSRVANGEILLDAYGNPARGRYVTAMRHAWAEYFDPVQGWVPVDPTFSTTVDGSLRVPAYVRENYNDRPAKATFQGGRIKADMEIQVEPAPPSIASSSTGA